MHFNPYILIPFICVTWRILWHDAFFNVTHSPALTSASIPALHRHNHSSVWCDALCDVTHPVTSRIHWLSHPLQSLHCTTIHLCDVTHFVTWRNHALSHLLESLHPHPVIIHQCDVTYSYQWWYTFICVPGHIRIRDMTRSFVSSARIRTCNMTCSWLEHVMSYVRIRDMTWSWLVCRCKVPHSLIPINLITLRESSFVRRDAFMRATWRIHSCDMMHSWHMHTCGMTHSFVWHDSCICATASLSCA